MKPEKNDVIVLDKKCDYRGCSGTLVSARQVFNPDNEVLHVAHCNHSWKHKYHYIEATGGLLRAAVGRWEKKPSNL